MTYVVAYDIADDKVRACLAKRLEAWGHRVQESVFECTLEVDDLPKLTEQLRLTLGHPTVGSIRVYRVCANCLQASLSIGAGRPAETRDSPVCLVV